MKKKQKTIEKLHSLATSARQRAYAPYSHYKVGACLVTEAGSLYSGCNVENASYGGTICAERVAIVAAIAAEGPLVKIKEILVVTAEKKPWPPCGLCRQVIAEFATPSTKVHLADEKKVEKTYRFSELLPEAFGPTHVKPQKGK